MVISGEPELPKRPTLRPGVRAVRRDDRHLQVGIGADRVLVPDTTAAREVLKALAGGYAPLPDTDEARDLCRRLLRAGLVIDDSAFRRTPLEPSAAAAVFADDPLEAPARLGRRAAAQVALDLPAAWHDLALQLVAGAGLGLADGEEPAGVRLLGSLGEPPRQAVDQLVRLGEPHLLLTCVEGLLALGPFVVPGRTACLRCVDAHLTETDPRRPLIVEQYSCASTARPVAEPCDPALLAIALGWAVRDLVTWAEGGTPTTWSATVPVTAGLDLTRRRWRRHPHCGCSWGDALAVG